MSRALLQRLVVVVCIQLCAILVADRVTNQSTVGASCVLTLAHSVHRLASAMLDPRALREPAHFVGLYERALRHVNELEPVVYQLLQNMADGVAVAQDARSGDATAASAQDAAHASWELTPPTLKK